MVGVLTLALAVPNTCTAGQQEWATTGKILTGVLLGGLFFNACAARPPCDNATVVCEQPVYEYQTVTRVYSAPACGPVYVSPRIVYVSPYCPPPRVVYAPPVVVYRGAGCRGYQTPFRGHPGYGSRHGGR